MIKVILTFKSALKLLSLIAVFIDFVLVEIHGYRGSLNNIVNKIKH